MICWFSGDAMEQKPWGGDAELLPGEALRVWAPESENSLCATSDRLVRKDTQLDSMTQHSTPYPKAGGLLEKHCQVEPGSAALIFRKFAESPGHWKFWRIQEQRGNLSCDDQLFLFSIYLKIK